MVANIVIEIFIAIVIDIVIDIAIGIAGEGVRPIRAGIALGYLRDEVRPARTARTAVLMLDAIVAFVCQIAIGRVGIVRSTGPVCGHALHIGKALQAIVVVLLVDGAAVETALPLEVAEAVITESAKANRRAAAE